MQSRTVTLMRLLVISALLMISMPYLQAEAQTLRVVESSQEVIITNPESSTAYYGELKGAAQTYKVSSGEPFTLFLALIVPDVPGITTDLKAEVLDTNNLEVPLTVLDGREVTWQAFTDTSGGDAYLAGPTFRATIPEGSYDIRISSPDNQGQYVIIIGEERGFSLGRIFQAYNALPQIKTQFFGKQPVEALTSPLLMWPTIVIALTIAAILILVAVVRLRRARTISRTEHFS